MAELDKKILHEDSKRVYMYVAFENDPRILVFKKNKDGSMDRKIEMAKRMVSDDPDIEVQKVIAEINRGDVRKFKKIENPNKVKERIGLSKKLKKKLINKEL